MPKVSVIIPVYNVEPFLRECLDSVIAQTFEDIEIICVDDGSTDRSVDVLNEYVNKDHRVRVVEGAHKNAGAARNIGFRMSKGQYLLFLDADDVFAPSMIRTLHDALEMYDADIANCSKVDFMSGKEIPKLSDGDLSKFEVLDNKKRKVNCFKEFVGWSWDKLFTRRLIERYGLFFQEQQAHNDFLFCNSACCLASKIARTSDVFIAHRKHADSIAVNRDKSPLCFSSAICAFYEKMDGLGYWKEYPKQLQYFNNYVVAFGLWTIDTLKKRESVETAYNELRRILKCQGALDKDKFYMNIYPELIVRYRSLCKHEDPLLFWREVANEERKISRMRQNQIDTMSKGICATVIHKIKLSLQRLAGMH